MPAWKYLEGPVHRAEKVERIFVRSGHSPIASNLGETFRPAERSEFFRPEEKTPIGADDRRVLDIARDDELIAGPAAVLFPGDLDLHASFQEYQELDRRMAMGGINMAGRVIDREWVKALFLDFLGDGIPIDRFVKLRLVHNG
jgi:hypothetical protein